MSVLKGLLTGVFKLNGLNGTLNIVAGSGISVSASGKSITVSSSGGGGVTSFNGLTGAIVLESTGGTITVSHPSGNNVNVDLPNSGVTPGNYSSSAGGFSCVINAKGIITSANLVTPSIFINQTITGGNADGSILFDTGTLTEASALTFYYDATGSSGLNVANTLYTPNLQVTTGFYDSTGSTGSNGQVLTSESGATQWKASTGTPGGTNGQVQYNNAGAFGGFTVSGDGTLNTSTGALSVSKIGGEPVSLGGSFTMSGAYTFTGTLTGNTSLTFPTSGTLVNTGVTTLSSLSSIGTITTGVWNGTRLTSTYIPTDVAYLDVTQTFTHKQTFTADAYINESSTTALNVENNGTNNNVLTVDTANGYVGIGCQPTTLFEIKGGAYEFALDPNAGFVSNMTNLSAAGPLGQAWASFASGGGIAPIMAWFNNRTGTTNYGVITASGVIFQLMTGASQILLNSSGSNNGVIQNDAGNAWSLATSSNQNAGTPIVQWGGTSGTPTLGFFNTTLVAKQSGDIGTALSNYNLVTSPTLAASSLTGTAGLFPTIVGNARMTGLTAAQALTTYTVGASDTTFQVSANVNITAVAVASFQVTCTYTDETNTSRTLVLNFSQISGTFVQTLTAALGTGAYEGVPLQIRAKAGTTIIIASASGGTYTSVTYNLEERIVQL